MSTRYLRSESEIYLIGHISQQIVGSKLPSIRQVLFVLFYNVRIVKLTISESANLAVRECGIYWEKGRIPNRAIPRCVVKLTKVYSEWRSIQKNCLRETKGNRKKEQEFQTKLDMLFDIAHADALQKIRIEEDKAFLISQRQTGRPGYLGAGGINKKLMEKEKRKEQRLRKEEERKVKSRVEQEPSTSTSPDKYEEGEEESDYDITSEEEYLLPPPAKKTRGKQKFITPKLVAVLDRCKLRVRDSMYVLEATAEALSHNINELIINRSSIHRCRKKLRVERAALIQNQFKESMPNYVIVHWDGKLLPALNVRDNATEYLPVTVTSENIEQLISIKKLQGSTGKDQADAVFEALDNWGLCERVQGLYCDTTASNTGRLKGACVLLEQRLGRSLAYFPCRHHIYELVLRCAFEVKLPQVTTSPDIPVFKYFQKNWKDIDPTKYLNALTDEKCLQVLNDKKDEIIRFAQERLQFPYRDDYREFLQLVIIFLGGNAENQFKIRPPGAMHQARWMSRAIYSLKIFLFRHQYTVSVKQLNSFRDICIFIVIIYIKVWFNCACPIQAPNQDLNFLKDLKRFENIDATMSSATINKFCNHLWYLTEETAALSFFDDNVSIEVKQKMKDALKTCSTSTGLKHLTLRAKDINEHFMGRTIDSFISENSNNFFERFDINVQFLEEDPADWNLNTHYIRGREITKSLNVVNDTAERSVRLVEDYHGRLTKDEAQKEFILRCVQEHRRLFPKRNKEILKKTF